MIDARQEATEAETETEAGVLSMKNAKVLGEVGAVCELASQLAALAREIGRAHCDGSMGMLEDARNWHLEEMRGIVSEISGRMDVLVPSERSE